MVNVMNIGGAITPYQLGAANCAAWARSQAHQYFPDTPSVWSVIVPVRLKKHLKALIPWGRTFLELCAWIVTLALVGSTNPWLRAPLASSISALFGAVQAFALGNLEGPNLKFLRASLAYSENHAREHITRRARGQA